MIESDEPISAEALGFDGESGNQVARLFLEGVSASTTLAHEEIEVVLTDSETDATASDEVRVTVVRADLDADSDNDGQLERDFHEEILEDSDFGLGLLSDRQGRAVLELQLPLVADFTQASVTFTLSGPARRIQVTNGGMPIDITSGATLTYEQLGITTNNSVNEIDILVTSTPPESLGVTQQTFVEYRVAPPTRDFLEISVDVGGLTLTDEVHIARPNEQLIISHIEGVDPAGLDLFDGPEDEESGIVLRHALAAEYIYGTGGGASNARESEVLGLELLDESQLRELLGSEDPNLSIAERADLERIIRALISGINPTSATPVGFVAGLYRDHGANNANTYILTFRGTDPDSIADIAANISNALGIGSVQHENAVLLGLLLPTALNESVGSNFLTVAGHSLGGGLATAAVAVNGLTVGGTLGGHVFNAAGIDLRTLTTAIQTNGNPLLAPLVSRPVAAIEAAVDAHLDSLRAGDNTDFAGVVNHANRADLLTNLQRIVGGIPTAAAQLDLVRSGPFDRLNELVTLAGDSEPIVERVDRAIRILETLFTNVIDETGPELGISFAQLAANASTLVAELGDYNVVGEDRTASIADRIGSLARQFGGTPGEFIAVTADAISTLRSITVLFTQATGDFGLLLQAHNHHIHGQLGPAAHGGFPATRIVAPPQPGGFF